MECRRDGNGKVCLQNSRGKAEPMSESVLTIYHRANKMDSQVPWILAALSAPGMAVKQWINVKQLINASKWLAEGDRAQRRTMGLPRAKKVR